MAHLTVIIKYRNKPEEYYLFLPCLVFEATKTIFMKTYFYCRKQNTSFESPRHMNHGLPTPGEEIAFTTARPKFKSQSQIIRYHRSIFCLPHWPKCIDIFDLCLHWVSVVRDCTYLLLRNCQFAHSIN